MLTPERLLGVIIELIFVMLGGLLIWLGLRGPVSGRIVDRHSVSWPIVGVALILWGFRALYKPGQWWRRWEYCTRGLSLVLLGVLMLAIIRVPFSWFEPMLMAAGAVLVLRGIVASALILRPR
ncbi:MAG TPA: hypothetical protein VJN92_09825 [Candidatus Acidoferrum sp.]|nr:hypothetical protein [Candidatus Acidoferrum sp.]